MKQYRVKTIVTARYTHDVEAADMDEAMQIAEERIRENEFANPDSVDYDSLLEGDDENMAIVDDDGEF